MSLDGILLFLIELEVMVAEIVHVAVDKQLYQLH
jgi:hypothetical protein